PPVAPASGRNLGERPKVRVARSDRARAQAAHDHLKRRSKIKQLMIIVDNALKARAEQGKPIKVAILGGGFMAQGLTNQIVNSVPAMSMVAIYSRKPQKAIHVLNYSGLENPIEASAQSQLDDAIRDGKPVFTQDVMLLARSEQVDLIVDTT